MTAFTSQDATHDESLAGQKGEAHPPLLATKLYIPRPRPGLVPRPALIEHLNAGLNCELTLIAAPAGFGKTTLTSEWIEQLNRPVAWLMLDPEDNDPARFWQYVTAALQTIDVSIGRTASTALQSPQPPSLEEIAASLANDLTATPQPFILVLDDYHVIENEAIHSSLDYLLDHLPPQLRLVIATRSDPPFSLARRRVRSELSEVRMAQLRFTPEEAATFLNVCMGLDLAAEDVDALDRRIEGWIAGLQMAALTLKSPFFAKTRNDADKHQFISAFAGDDRHIADYLIEEVLQNQPFHLQIFLLQTSILERFCSDLCDAVTGRDDGQAMLAMIEQANLFIEPLDNRRQWYRYHPLFAELLRWRLRQPAPIWEGKLETPEALHLRASQWYEQEGLISEAVSHSLASSQIPYAAALVERHATDVINAMRGRIYLRLGGSASQITIAAEQALAGIPEDDQVSRSIVLYVLGVSQNDYQTCIRTLAEARATSEACGNFYHALMAAWAEAVLLCETGQLDQAADVCRDALASIVEPHEQSGTPLPVSCGVYIVLGTILAEWGDLNAAEELLRKGMALKGQGAHICPTSQHWGLEALARIKRIEGDFAGAVGLFEQYADLFEPRLDEGLTGPIEVRLWLAQAGQDQELMDTASEWAASRRIRPSEKGEHSWAQLSLARLLIAQRRARRGQPDMQALFRSLERQLHNSTETGFVGAMIETSILLALAWQVEGDRTQALDALARALELAEPGGYIRLFVDEGTPMLDLLREIQEPGREIPRSYVDTLIAAFDASTDEEEAALSANSQLDEPLTPREIEILQMVAGGASNAQIAEEMFISIDTVKRHVTHIFLKLDVNNRTQATIRAQDLGLVE
jgi:LuxR family maltose regulon positive regulatory protein